MSISKNFHEKTFGEKVNLLVELEKNNSHDAIPDLFEICKLSDPSDQALFMAENTLRALLMENEQATVRGLSSESSNIRKICIQICNQKNYPSATPVLLSLLESLNQQEEKEDEIFDALSALSHLKAPEALDIFRKNIHHKSPMIAELSIEAIGKYQDIESINALSEIIMRSGEDEKLVECDIITASAIESIGKMKNEKAISFLSSVIHHKNPNTRRVIHEVATDVGQEMIPEISKYFEQEEIDPKIMAANILGEIGGKKSSDVLVTAIDKGAANHPNIMFAIYEALGNIPSMKSIVCLADGLNEPDEMLLIAVVTSIERQINPGVIETVKKIIQKEDDQSKRLIKAIVSSRAISIFEALYDDEKIGDALINAIGNSNDRTVISEFYLKLNGQTNEKAKADAQKIKKISTKESNKSILAVDDSKAMVLFYQSTISEMGHHVETALNGQEAYDKIEAGKTYALIITDMNMPLMNGIELTQKVRTHERMASVPIIMATTESENSQVEIGKKAGVNVFIQKPFSADDLKNEINQILNK